MTAAEYLASEPVGNADLLEMLRRGTADVLYCTQHALAMHERVSGAAVLCAETEREARAALEHLPHTGLYVAKKLGVDYKECLYVGDSEVDVVTGKNAGVKTIAVTWGFRTKEELMIAGAQYMIDKAEKLQEYL